MSANPPRINDLPGAGLGFTPLPSLSPQGKRRRLGAMVARRMRRGTPDADWLRELDQRLRYIALGALVERRAAGADALAASFPDLSPFELSVYSQNGEDGVIAEILRRVGEGDRTFVEFGVETATQGTCVLLAELGWHGTLIEADPAFHRALAARWADRSNVLTMRALVTPQNVDELFDAASVPEEPTIVSIDIDGDDAYVWRALMRRPRLLVIEYNAHLSRAPDVLQAQAPNPRRWDGTARFGASLGALESVAREKGYALVHTDLTGVNAFFVREDLVPGSGLPTGHAVPRRGANYRFSGGGHGGVVRLGE